MSHLVNISNGAVAFEGNVGRCACRSNRLGVVKRQIAFVRRHFADCEVLARRVKQRTKQWCVRRITASNLDSRNNIGFRPYHYMDLYPIPAVLFNTVLVIL